MIEMERKINQDNQHGRKANFEIDGIPDRIEQKDLRETAVQIFNHAGIEGVTGTDIEVIHRLKSKKEPKPVIVKAKRDFIENVFAKKENNYEHWKNQNGV